jgi:hypothetical protein
LLCHAFSTYINAYRFKFGGAKAGRYNIRKQFVVKKYAVIGKTKIMMEFEMMKI